MDRKNKNGFTIIELLVVTAIIAIISAMVLANYRSGEKQYIFNQAMQKLVSDKDILNHSILLQSLLL